MRERTKSLVSSQRATRRRRRVVVVLDLREDVRRSKGFRRWWSCGLVIECIHMLCDIVHARMPSGARHNGGKNRRVSIVGSAILERSRRGVGCIVLGTAKHSIIDGIFFYSLLRFHSSSSLQLHSQHLLIMSDQDGTSFQPNNVNLQRTTRASAITSSPGCPFP